MRSALLRHDGLLSASIGTYGGLVFASMGDGVGAAFSRAGDALAAAVELQRHFMDAARADNRALRVRMGIHAGEAEERDGTYFGPTVNRAARLMAAASGGQIVVSEVVARLLPVGMPVQLRDLGAHRFAGISEPLRVFGVSADGVAWLDHPLQSATVSGNLPASAGRFVGRRLEVIRIGDDLATRPVITLAGSAGVGKTRLALEVARSKIPSYPDGVWMVELAAVDEPDAVVHTVAETLGLDVQGLRPLDALADALRQRHCLLLLDNCEHVRPAAATLVRGIVAGAPALRVLATSREPLGVSGEQVWPVRPLDIDHESVELFCDRAAMADPDFRLDTETRPLVERVCAQLDGLPLAIELAAARSRAFSLAELSERLQNRLRLLRARAPDMADRHQTLEAAIDWSYRLLEQRERILFERLTVFMGTFDRGAADRVCAFEPVDSGDIDDLLAALVDRSMVNAEHAEPVTRFSLLESMRQFGQIRLDERAETAEVRRRHVEHYLAYAVHADGQWRAPGGGDASNLFVREWDNLRSAHSWSVASGDVESALALTEAIVPWAVLSGIRPEVGDWVDRALLLAEQNDRLSPRMLGIASVCCHNLGDEEQTEHYADHGIELATEPIDDTTAWCWFGKFAVSTFAGRAAATDEAHAVRQSLEAAGDAFDFVILGCYTLVAVERELVSEHLARLGELAARLANPVTDAAMGYAIVLERWRLGDLDTAMDRIDSVVTLARRAGVGTLVFNTIWMRIVLSIEQGREDSRTLRAIRQILDRMRFVPFPWLHRWWLIDSIAGYAAVVGAAEPAAVLLGALSANGVRPNLYLAGVHARTTERLDSHGGSADWFASGARLSADEAFAYAEQQLAVLLQRDGSNHVNPLQGPSR
jgi:predicted ATPase